MRQRETRRVTVADQAAERYPRFVFDLPAGAGSFEVELAVDGAGVIDLGLEGPDGWRGWSGGARRRFTVAEDDATPGYIPGNVVAGAWAVVLGLHSLPGEGATVTVTVTAPAVHPVDHGPVVPPVPGVARGSARELPAPPGLRWYAGDLHAHSLHSDGALSLWELANEAVRSGLDFLAVTDHNTVSHHAHLPGVSERQGVLLVPGQEVTTHRGHANVFGDVGFIDFRRPASQWAADAVGRGGLMSINHPVAGDCSWLHPAGVAPAAVELYHGDWYREPISTAPLAWFRAWARDAAVIGGGDFHNRSTDLRPGMPTTWVAAEECSSEAILAGIAAGRTTVTASARMTDDGARPLLEACPVLLREGDRLQVLEAAGTVLVSGEGERSPVTSAAEKVAAPVVGGPYRLELPDRTVVALCR